MAEERGPTLIALIDKLARAIDAIDLSKAALLQRAFEEGGGKRAATLLAEAQMLRDARAELILRGFDQSTAAFAGLAKDAGAAAERIEAAAKHFERVAEVLDGIAEAIGLIGRLIIRFGL